jgi:Ni/Fe-hydrogenase subunit HybB-like protein
MSEKALGGPFITKTTVLAGLMVAAMGILVLIRFVFGLRSITNLSDGFPLGLWLAYDMVAGTAIGCGGYALAIVVYALNKGQYHPLVRPAVLASMFGYSLGGFSVMIDISRWWNFWHIMWPTYFNFNSVLIEVALCVCVYTTILILEFAPALVEKAVELTGGRGSGLHALTLTIQKWLNRFLFVLIAIGMTLPTMHQSSLGSMLIPMGNLINPLWQTPILPALFLMSALFTGFSVVMLEATLVSDRFNRPSEAPMLGRLSQWVVGLMVLFMVVRWSDLIIHGKLHYIFTSGGLGLAFLLENALYLTAIFLLWRKERRMAPRYQFIAAMCLLVGGILYRLDAYLIAYGRPGWHYFPSVPEQMVTYGAIAVEVLGYVLIVKYFPILHHIEHADTAMLESK